MTLHPINMATVSVAVLTLLAPGAVPAQADVHEFREIHMGLEVRLVVHADQALARSAAHAAFDRIATLEAILSDWRLTSEVRRLEFHAPGTRIQLSPELFEVLERALVIAVATDGAFEPTIGALTAQWREQRRTGVAPSPEAVAAARASVGYHGLMLDLPTRSLRMLRPGTRLDLGGIAKGWILDRARDTLTALGIDALLIEAGGDIVTGAPPPGTAGWRIAIDTPQGDTVITVHHRAISTSGPRFQRIQDPDGTWRSHVIDPRTGKGLTSTRQVSVLAAEGAIADALATALTVMDEASGRVVAAKFGVTAIWNR